MRAGNAFVKVVRAVFVRVGIRRADESLEVVPLPAIAHLVGVGIEGNDQLCAVGDDAVGGAALIVRAEDHLLGRAGQAGGRRPTEPSAGKTGQRGRRRVREKNRIAVRIGRRHGEGCADADGQDVRPRQLDTWGLVLRGPGTAVGVNVQRVVPGNEETPVPREGTGRVVGQARRAPLNRSCVRVQGEQVRAVEIDHAVRHDGRIIEPPGIRRQGDGPERRAVAQPVERHEREVRRVRRRTTCDVVDPAGHRGRHELAVIAVRMDAQQGPVRRAEYV